MSSVRLVLASSLFVAVSATAHVAAAAPAGDRFLEGVASAVLELEFGLNDVDVVVEDGLLQLDPSQLRGHDPEAVRTRLDGLRGLEVAWVEHGRAATLRMVPAGAALPEPEVRLAAHDAAALTTGFLPQTPLFDILLADPRAPVTGTSYQSYLDDDEFDNIGAVNFGGSLPTYGWQLGNGTWQIGLEGGVFSIFDLDGASSDLVNSDFLAALPLETRYGDFSARARFYHQSSHLGDEFLLRFEVERDNLSYEGVDLLLAYDLFDALRLYGGGGSLLRRSPSELERFSVQGGAELKSPTPVLTSFIYPLAAVDLQARQETDWHVDVSTRAGVELRNGFLAGNRVQLLAEYFKGRSPNGQFFREAIEYAGFGVRVLF